MEPAIAAVTTSLKRVLKKKRVSYRELARRLRLSESGVKKMMTAPDLSLSRLWTICAALEVDLLDLLAGALHAPRTPFSFSAAQEKFLADNPGEAAFLIALITADFDTGEVARRYGLDRASMKSYLERLEKHRFVERTEDGGARSLLGNVEYMRGTLAAHLTVPSLERALAAAPSDRCMRTGRVRLTAQNLDKLNRELLDLLLRYAIVGRQDALYVRDDHLVDVWVIAGTARQHLSEVLSIPPATVRGTTRRRR